MKIEKTLTLENFFNRMRALYPISMNRFCDWIDEYKIVIDWDVLFDIVAITPPYKIKFHMIPNAMQLGIFIAFIRDENLGQDYVIDLFAFNIEDFIEDYLKHTNE